MDILICLFLVISTLAVYWQVKNSAFVFDDTLYITDNPHVQSGFTPESIKWAFNYSNRPDHTYWHPLTWFSHMLDCRLFALNPCMHHLDNLFFHIVNSLLLFIVFRRMTGTTWESAFVAALFALHPINVDSVAWIAERKNLLSTFFWLLTMLAYTRYSERPCILRYLPVFVAFALGLLAKPMLVTLPFVLLLLDYWPLKRIKFEAQNSKNNIQRIDGTNFSTTSILQLILEKVPFFILSAISIRISTISSHCGDQIISTKSTAIGLRIANALVSYVAYIGKMIYPRNLTVFYPYPETLPVWQVIGAFLLLVGVSAFIVIRWKRFPYLVTGWLWYLGTLVPVIGLMQVGLWPAMADRWAYVPLIGVFTIIAWGISDLQSRWHVKKITISMSAATFLTLLMMVTWVQAGYWKNSFSLFSHAIEVTSNNYLAHNNLGLALKNKGDVYEAIYHYSEALRIDPEYILAHNNLGIALAEQGRTDEAFYHFSKALRLKPDFAEAHNNLGYVLAGQGKIFEAFSHYHEALRIKPGYATAQINLRKLLAERKMIDKAAAKLREALKANPENPALCYELGTLYQKTGEDDKALSVFKKLIELQPDNADIYYNISCLYSRQNKTEESIDWLKKAIRIGYKNWGQIKTNKDLENIRGSLYYKKFIRNH